MKGAGGRDRGRGRDGDRDRDRRQGQGQEAGTGTGTGGRDGALPPAALGGVHEFDVFLVDGSGMV